MPTKREQKKRLLQDLVVSLSSANIFFFKQWSDLTLSSSPSPHTDWFYEAVSATPASYTALVVLVFALALGFFSVITIARKLGGNNAWYVAHLVPLVGLLSMMNGLRIAMGMGPYAATLGWWRFPFYALLGGALLIGFLRFKKEACEFLRGVVITLLPFTVMTFFHAARGFYSSQQAELELRAAAVSYMKSGEMRANLGSQRVVVNLFDELDYHRITDPRVEKDLPELAFWKKNALFAHNARPPGRSTAYSIPSFFLGERVVEPLFLKEMRFTYGVKAKTGETELKRWRNQMNMVIDLKRQGYKVAVIGWYLPYCRMFFYSADRCKRYSHYNFLKRPYSDSMVESMENLLSEVAEFRPSRQKAHLRTYNEIVKVAEETLKDSSYQFVFIHWPVPHAPWIYTKGEGFNSNNRKGPEGYFDNLLGVEQTMKREREWLSTTGQWDSTNLVMLSDHGWNSSAEFDGVWDVRTPFLVKLNGQTRGVDYHKPFNTVVLRDLVGSVLHDEVKNVGELTSWLDSHSEPEIGDPSS